MNATEFVNSVEFSRDARPEFHSLTKSPISKFDITLNFLFMLGILLNSEGFKLLYLDLNTMYSRLQRWKSRFISQP